MAFLLGPLIFEIGIAIAETTVAALTELGISSSVAGAVGAGVSGVAVSQLSGAINQKAIDVIGKDRIDGINERFHKTLLQGSQVYNQDIMGLTGLPAVGRSGGMNFNHHDPRETAPPISNQQDTIAAKELLGDVVKSITAPKIHTKHIADFITLFASGIAQQSLDTNIVKPEVVIKTLDPNLSKVLGNFLNSKIPTTDEYKAIANVYNGRNLTMANCVTKYSQVNEGLNFTLIDELGNQAVLAQNKGTVLPAMYGVFLGPNSPNNAQPVDLLDLFCAFHDKDYAVNGYFHRQGDYKLISRISQNFERFSPQAKPYARMAITYFSTAGHLISSMTGTLPKDISKNVSDVMTKDDIFPLVVPESVNMPVSQYTTERTKFYADLEKDISVSSVTSSSFVSRPNTILAYEFGNILVQME
jgi:hypothetical protein